MVRLQKDNFDVKMAKAYLLPNFISRCCEQCGFDSIKYKNNNCVCVVLWNGDCLRPKEGTMEEIHINANI